MSLMSLTYKSYASYKSYKLYKTYKLYKSYKLYESYKSFYYFIMCKQKFGYLLNFCLFCIIITSLFPHNPTTSQLNNLLKWINI